MHFLRRDLEVMPGFALAKYSKKEEKNVHRQLKSIDIDFRWNAEKKFIGRTGFGPCRSTV